LADFIKVWKTLGYNGEKQTFIIVDVMNATGETFLLSLEYHSFSKNVNRNTGFYVGQNQWNFTFVFVFFVENIHFLPA